MKTRYVNKGNFAYEKCNLFISFYLSLGPLWFLTIMFQVTGYLEDLKKKSISVSTNNYIAD